LGVLIYLLEAKEHKLVDPFEYGFFYFDFDENFQILCFENSELQIVELTLLKKFSDFNREESI